MSNFVPGLMRNTPAYAGKTKGQQRKIKNIEKHPRVCGEDYTMCLKRRRALETPPRMRGRLIGTIFACALIGNTTAYAGKTIMNGKNLTEKEKHPRVCGEDPESASTVSGMSETPPRMRGRPYMYLFLPHPSGNTPAYAGKTQSR